MSRKTILKNSTKEHTPYAVKLTSSNGNKNKTNYIPDQLQFCQGKCVTKINNSLIESTVMKQFVFQIITNYILRRRYENRENVNCLSMQLE